jgi:hypothetical protein
VTRVTLRNINRPAKNWGFECLTAFTAACRRVRSSNDEKTTYENSMSDGHSMRLCSIRRTHYCSLEMHQRLLLNIWGVEMTLCETGNAKELSVQPDRHEPEPRAMVGAEHTAGRHTRLHVGSISVGASVFGGGGLERDGVLSRRAPGSGGELAAVDNVSNSLPRRRLSELASRGVSGLLICPRRCCGGEARRGVEQQCITACRPRSRKADQRLLSTRGPLHVF